jgi:hypothetical protein
MMATILLDKEFSKSIFLIIWGYRLPLLPVPSFISSVGESWHFGADPDPAQDPTPDPSSFFISFTDAK